MLCEGSVRLYFHKRDNVLILVLMEYALRAMLPSTSVGFPPVLILVLMEYALRECAFNFTGVTPNGLNPCFNGICSASYFRQKLNTEVQKVLILVLMEYALRVRVCALSQ